MSIPRIIHYCWFGGGKLSAKERKCMQSWEKHCPEFIIMRWDESNVAEDDSTYLRQALAQRLWAFASDYVRLKALNKYGGIYLDTDVELLRSPLEYMDSDVFIGRESRERVGTAVIGSIPRHAFTAALLGEYSGRTFVDENGTPDLVPNVVCVTALLESMGLRREDVFQDLSGIAVYPTEYFSPKDLVTGKLRVTENTCAVHHFKGSWLPAKSRINRRIAQLLGPDMTARIKGAMRKKGDG